MESNNKRVRMNISLNSKGRVQFDITAEYDTPEETANQLKSAIDNLRSVIAEKDLKLVDTI